MLRTARKGAGLSQVKAAELAGVGRATIQVAERTGETSTRTLCALASAYQRDVVLAPTASEQSTGSGGCGNRTPRRRGDAPGPGSTEEDREQFAV